MSAEHKHGILIALDDSQAAERALQTVSLPWYRELFHGHACDELVRRGEGFTVWVVEWE